MYCVCAAGGVEDGRGAISYFIFVIHIAYPFSILPKIIDKGSVES